MGRSSFDSAKIFLLGFAPKANNAFSDEIVFAALPGGVASGGFDADSSGGAEKRKQEIGVGKECDELDQTEAEAAAAAAAVDPEAVEALEAKEAKQKIGDVALKGLNADLPSSPSAVFANGDTISDGVNGLEKQEEN